MKIILIVLSIFLALYAIYSLIKAYRKNKIERLDRKNLQLTAEALLDEGMMEIEYNSFRTPFEHFLEGLEENSATAEDIEFLRKQSNELEKVIKLGNKLLKIYRRQKNAESLIQEQITKLERLVKIKERVEEILKPEL